jgi:hypothetical protein
MRERRQPDRQACGRRPTPGRPHNRPGLPATRWGSSPRPSASTRMTSTSRPTSCTRRKPLPLTIDHLGVERALRASSTNFVRPRRTSAGVCGRDCRSHRERKARRAASALPRFSCHKTPAWRSSSNGPTRVSRQRPGRACLCTARTGYTRARRVFPRAQPSAPPGGAGRACVRLHRRSASAARRPCTSPGTDFPYQQANVAFPPKDDNQLRRCILTAVCREQVLDRTSSGSPKPATASTPKPFVVATQPEDLL